MTNESATDEGLRDARAERLELASDALRFRSLLARGAEDQRAAVRKGYDSVEQLAIDELGQFCHELLLRIEALEVERSPAPRTQTHDPAVGPTATELRERAAAARGED